MAKDRVTVFAGPKTASASSKVLVSKVRPDNMGEVSGSSNLLLTESGAAACDADVLTAADASRAVATTIARTTTFFKGGASAMTGA